MISSVNNSKIEQTIPTTIVSSKTTEEANESTGEKVAESNGKNSKTDTVKISDQAKVALHSSTAAALQNSVSPKKASMPSLSGLSESQMNQLVSTKTITSSQEHTELASRKSTQNADSVTSTHQNNTHGIDTYA